jgi:signal transduction histidine kinase
MIRRRSGLLAVFLVTLVTTVLGVAATVNRRAAEAREARATLVRGADLMASLVDESLEELRAREDARPFDHYNEVYRPDGVVAASDAVAPSPLTKTPDDRRILGWFQVNPDGSITVPHERSRKEAAQRIREVVAGPAFAPMRALAKPKAGLEEIDPELALLDSQLGYAKQQSLQELNAASAEVYKQLKEAGEAPQKRAALAENPKLPTIERNDVEWSSTDLGKIGSRAKGVKQPPQLNKKKSKGADVVAVDYTPMVYDAVDVDAQGSSVLTLHRVVAKGGSTAVQGVLLDDSHLQAQWLPGLLQRRVGMAPAILAHTTPATCTLRTPVSEVFDGLDLCFADDDRAAFPAAEVMLLIALFVLVVLVLVLLEFTAQRAEALSRQKSAFISAISHELRTPLTTLRMHAELMRDGLVTDPQKQHRFHDDMVKESVRLGHLVENVLEAQRLEEGRRPLRTTRFDIGEAVVDICAGQRALCESRGFAVRTTLPPEAPEEEGGGDVDLTGNFDRQALDQIVVNLLENAVKYAVDAKAAGIDVDVARVGDDVVVTVRDHGPGIPAAERERVFQRFHRVMRPGEDHIAGTGLGLALVRELARAHGGDAVVKDVDEGCAVAVRLPLG